MDGCRAGVGERQAGDQAPEGHVIPRPLVTWLVYRTFEGTGNEANRFFSETIGNRILADKYSVRRPALGNSRTISLDRVTKGVDAGVRSDVRRTRNRQGGVHDSPPRDDFAAGDADLHRSIGICHHGNRAHLGSSA
jgi:hypothetical protein